MLQDEKYSKFVAAITREANEKRDDVIRQIEDYKNKKLQAAEDSALKECYSQIQHKTAMLREDIGRETSQQEMESRKKLFTKRSEIKDRVFDEVKSKINEFTQSDDYKDFLCSSAAQIAASFSNNESAVVMLRQADLKFSNDIAAAVPMKCDFEADDEISLGGLKIRFGKLVADDTLDTRLIAQNTRFEENCGLDIK